MDYARNEMSPLRERVPSKKFSGWAQIGADYTKRGTLTCQPLTIFMRPFQLSGLVLLR